LQIGVDQKDTATVSGKRPRKIDGDGRLADAPF